MNRKINTIGTVDKTFKRFLKPIISRKENKEKNVRLHRQPLTIIAQTAKSIVLHRQSQDEFDTVLNLKLS